MSGETSTMSRLTSTRSTMSNQARNASIQEGCASTTSSKTGSAIIITLY